MGATTTVTDANFTSDVLQADKPVLVDFWAEPGDLSFIRHHIDPHHGGIPERPDREADHRRKAEGGATGRPE